MKNNLNMFFLLILISSTLMIISSNSWFSIWLNLEINLMSFIAIIANNSNILLNESSMKYFLIQALASIILLLSILIFTLNFSLYFNLPEKTLMLMIQLPLLIKLGASPFHTWFIDLMKNMNWLNCFILMTWQKLAPLFIITYMTSKSYLIIMIIILSALVGGWGGLNQLDIKKLLAYSSVNHIAWMLVASLISLSTLLFYFTFYMILNLLVILSFTQMKISFINQSFILNKMNILTKILLLISLLSLGGLPPLLGFLPKWTIINFMMQNNMTFIALTLILSSLLTLYYYLYPFYSSSILLNFQPKWMIWNMNNSFFIIFLFITLNLILCFALIFLPSL
uniref:NADH-ubiquinone oxidoreductase chain 2 n=1 Tax=Speleketor irwini TaxID=342007 RepID=A0A343QCH4_9NEOP|nr:NADH dehydrogenase subunit 2 [Speleketor irwini]ATU07121.1 NADH dehydrogenase subunit 2 [Speleketor irwini]